MSAPSIISASLPSFCQKYQNWWKFGEVLTKTILHSIFETQCIVGKICGKDDVFAWIGTAKERRMVRVD